MVEPQHKTNILLVDDRRENLIALEAVLRDPEYNLVEAQSGREALRFLLTGDCAVILMDVQMPDLDGLETARLIRKNPRTRNVPIIFITAISTEEPNVEQGYVSGAVDYISKPFNPQILRAKVAVFVELQRNQQQIRDQAEQLREAERRERDRTIAEIELRALRREQAIQQKYRDLVEGIDHAIIWSAHPDSMTISFVSPSAPQILGYSMDEWMNEPGFFVHHVHPEDRQTVETYLHGVREGVQDAGIEHRFIRKDGHVAWLHTGVRVARKGEGAGEEIRGLSVDMTRVQEATAALERSERRAKFMAEAGLILSESLDYETTIERVGKLVVPRLADWFVIDLLDENQNLQSSLISHANPEMIELARELRRRYPPEPGTGGPYEVLRSRKPQVVKSISDEQIRAGAIDSEHYEMLRKLKLHSYIMVPLVAHGRAIGTMSMVSAESGTEYDDGDLQTAVELGRRVSMAIDNAFLYSQAQHAIRARDEFLSIASHELKTPLTPLKLHTQTVIRTLARAAAGGEWQPDRLRKLLVSADRQVSRLSQLIDELLDVSRINIGKLQIEKEPIDVARLTGDVVQRFCEEFAQGSCPLHYSNEGPVRGEWDRFRVEQVIINLITNAMKYGEGKPIEIRVQEEEGRALISVKDHGIGISKQDQQRIFERFERAVSSSHFGGLGLGLYIVREILRAHGGQIRVSSELGKGSEFVVELPVRAKQEQGGGQAQNPPGAA